MTNPFSRIFPLFKGGQVENFYSLEGPVPFLKALPFIIQHILAMFVSTITPILIILSISYEGTYLDSQIIENGIRTALFFSGLATIFQLLPVWKFGSKLPVICGSSFTFIGSLSFIASLYGFQTMFLASIIGGIVAIAIGLSASIWGKWIKPIVGAIVVLALGLSLLGSAAKQFLGLDDIASLSAFYDFSLAWPYLVVASTSLLATLLFRIFVKGIWKNVSIGVGLAVGYLVALCFPGMLDFSLLHFHSLTDFLDVPRPIFTLLSFSWGDFNLGATISVCLVYLVGIVDAFGGVTALTNGLDGRRPSGNELAGLAGSLGFFSTLAGLFGGVGLSSYIQNASITIENRARNKAIPIAVGLFLALSSFFPLLPRLMLTVPKAALGGVTMMLFASIALSGMRMIVKCGANAKNTIIVCLSLGLGFGLTLVPSFVQAEQSSEWVTQLLLIVKNPVASMFVISLVLSYALPKRLENTIEEG